MASNRFKLFENDNGHMRLSPLGLAFIAFQIVLFVTIFIIIIWFNNDKLPDDDITRYERIPELTIEGLADRAPILTETEIVDIQKKVFQIVSENTNKINVDKIKATIRDGETHAQTFNGNSKYMNMILDIPDLEQSYEVFYGSNAMLNPGISTFVLCIDDHTQIIYDNFECKSSDSESIREQVVTTYLKYFRFEYFSAYIDPEKPDTVVLSPSVTFNNSEATKAKYIKEVKEAIDSLGVSSESYDYYVRTAKDVNYERN